jgi:hypothetical protein
MAAVGLRGTGRPGRRGAAPIAAVYAFVTGEPGQALIALGLFVGSIVYLVLVIFDAIDRPWDPRRTR